MRRPSGPGFVIGALLGGALGAGFATVFAARSGEETRRRLASWRDSDPADGGNQDSSDVSQLGQELFRQALRRVEYAYRAARQAREAANISLAQEWDQRKRGGPTPT